MGELVALGLYFLQQFGVMFGVSAAAIILIAHLVATRDGVITEKEARVARIIERLLMVGLLCIIVSGVLITLFHSASGEFRIIFSPAFIFKWILIAIVSIPLIVGHKHAFAPIWFEGFIGASWFALFALHIIAPVATWLDLIIVYTGWLACFLVLWWALARVVQGKSIATAKTPSLSVSPAKAVMPVIKKVAAVLPKQTVLPPAPKPPVAALAPKPATAPLAPVMPKSATPVPHKAAELPPGMPTKPAAPIVPSKPAEAAMPIVPAKPYSPPRDEFIDQAKTPYLPAIRVMPKKPEDVDNEHRATVVQFS